MKMLILSVKFYLIFTKFILIVLNYNNSDDISKMVLEELNSLFIIAQLSFLNIFFKMESYK